MVPSREARELGKAASTPIGLTKLHSYTPSDGGSRMCGMLGMTRRSRSSSPHRRAELCSLSLVLLHHEPRHSHGSAISTPPNSLNQYPTHPRLAFDVVSERRSDEPRLHHLDLRLGYQLLLLPDAIRGTRGEPRCGPILTPSTGAHPATCSLAEHLLDPSLRPNRLSLVSLRHHLAPGPTHSPPRACRGAERYGNAVLRQPPIAETSGWSGFVRARGRGGGSQVSSGGLKGCQAAGCAIVDCM